MPLYIVPVPIGNLGDITLRAIETLKSVDLVAAEDTRYSLKLLNHLGIKKRMVSYFKPKELEKSAYILQQLTEGQSVALITDSGTPGISDPGFILIRQAIEAGIKVESLPGPTAFVPALTLSGISCAQFLFLGFPPRKTGELELYLKNLKALDYALIFYESPRRLEHFMAVAAKILGNRSFAIVKEISKKNERVIRGNLHHLETLLSQEVLLGEFVVIIEGYGEQKEKETESIQLDSLEDIFTYFKENHGISKNQLKKVLMRKT